MAQAYFARRSMIQSSEWEKAKVTIENTANFKEKLKETALYGKTEALRFSDRLWPDFTTPEGYIASDTLRNIYHSFFENSTDFHIQSVTLIYEEAVGLNTIFLLPIH